MQKGRRLKRDCVALKFVTDRILQELANIYQTLNQNIEL